MASLASLKEIIRCLKEEWLLIRFWDRRTAMMFCCTEHSIALRWSHTFSGKLETEFFANKFSIKLIIKKKTHLPVDSVKRLGSFENTWWIEDFSCDHLQIWSNIGDHSKLSSTNVEQPTMFRNKKRSKIGEYRIEIGRVRCGLGIYCFIHSPTQQDSIVAYKPLRQQATKTGKHQTMHI